MDSRHHADTRRSRTVLGLSGLVLLFMATGCLSLPASQTERADAITLSGSWSLDSDKAGRPLCLTQLVSAPEIGDLVDRALAQNPDLKQTALTLESAGLVTSQRGAERLPSVSTTLTATSERTTQTTTDRLSSGLSVSWELDLWGRLADNRQAAIQDEQAAAEDLAAARNSLAGNVIKGWLTLAETRLLLDIDTRQLALSRANEALIRSRYRAGLNRLEDLDAARTASASAAASLESRKLALSTARRSLQTYLGSLSGLPDATPERLPAVAPPMTDIPAGTLGLRPDLKAAYHRLQAADSRQKVAYKAMLPAFTLNPTTALSGESPSTLLRASPVWTLLGELSAPILDGKKRKTEARTAAITARSAYWRYRKTLISAVTEVETFMDTETRLTRREALLETAWEHACTTRNHIEARYRKGLSTIFDLQTAQKTAYTLESDLLEARLSLLTNRIDLGLALGLGV